MNSQLCDSGLMPATTLPATRLARLLGSAAQTSPAYRGIADGIQLLVADGRVTPGTRLPSERELTGALGVSRTTVTRAYAELRDRGYATSRQGSGTVATLPFPRQGHRGSGLNPAGDAAGAIDLTCAAMTAPPGVASAYHEAVAELPAHTNGVGYHPLGLPALRAAIAARYTERGLDTSPDEVMVTSGALAGVALAARALLGPGDRVLVESPSYPNAIATLAGAGARAVPFPVDDGWDAGAFADLLRQSAPRAAFLIPDFHNPTGHLLSTDDRARAADALAQTGTTPIVDETLAELSLEAGHQAPRPFAAWSRGAVTVGSASKTFWGGLRLGWLRAPAPVMSTLLQHRLTLDLGAPVVEQLALVHLLDRREELLQERRAALTVQRVALAAALRTQLPEWGFRLPVGGLSLWCQLPRALSTALTVTAEREGLLLAAGPQFSVGPGLERRIRLPFTPPVEVLDTAVARLAVAWESACASSRPTRRDASRETQHAFTPAPIVA